MRTTFPNGGLPQIHVMFHKLLWFLWVNQTRKTRNYSTRVRNHATRVTNHATRKNYDEKEKRDERMSKNPAGKNNVMAEAIKSQTKSRNHKTEPTKMGMKFLNEKKR